MLLLLLSDWVRTDKCGWFVCFFFFYLEQKAVPGKVQCRHKSRACSCECKFQDVFPGFMVKKWLKDESHSIRVALWWNLCRVKWKWVCEEKAPRFSFFNRIGKSFFYILSLFKQKAWSKKGLRQHPKILSVHKQQWICVQKSECLCLNLLEMQVIRDSSDKTLVCSWGY